MIHYDLGFMSVEWFQARVGIPTASCFDKLVTPKRGDPSAQAEDYSHTLLAEIVLQRPLEKFAPSFWMEEGIKHEEDAAAMYAYQVGVDLQNGGFITTDDHTAGASPDRLVGDVGLVEIKCPAPWTHMEYLLSDKVADKYIPQLQGQLLISGREWVDWFSYHPEMPPACIRTYRDEPYIAKLQTALDSFTEMMHKKLQRLVSIGALTEIPDLRPKISDPQPEPDHKNYLLAG